MRISYTLTSHCAFVIGVIILHVIFQRTLLCSLHRPKSKMSRLFQLGDDSFRNLLSWLDIVSICYLDIAVGNVGERLLWLHSLQMMDSQAVDEYEHNHSSIRWLIMRGARITRIRVGITQSQFGRINDETFKGIGILYVPNMSRSKGLVSVLRNVLRRAFGFSMRNCNITNGADTDVSVRMHGCPHLKHIDLSRTSSVVCDTSNILCFTDIGVLAIAQGCRHLSTINLDGWYNISDIGVSAIAEGCHHLTSISLGSCLSISDLGISAIAQGCPDLISISLYGCEGISDIGISAIAQGCSDLRSIDLSCCGYISDIGISAIAQGCPDLRSISLGNCRSISDIGISVIAQGCPLLRSIDLSDCEGISDAGISAIAQGCPLFISFDLSGCESISDIGISAIAQGCNDLKSMYLYNCVGITSRCYSILEKDFSYIVVRR